jgi:hypothetical protein
MYRLPRKLPHLNAALMLTPKEDQTKGMCFHRTVGFVLDVPPARLCVGTLRAATEEELREIPHASPVPFIHCWAQIGQSVYAPTTIEAQAGRLRPFKLDEYYLKNGVSDVRMLTRRTLLQLSEKYGLAHHLLYRTPVRENMAFADVILSAVEVEYVLNESEGVLPAG